MKAILALLLVVGLGFAGALEQAALNYLEPGMQIVDAVQMPLSNGSSVYIIPLEGKETLMIGNWSPNAIEDEGAMLAILRDGVLVQASTANAKAELAALTKAIVDLKRENETKCAQFTGTETHECVDKDTCNVAAQSSPQAQVMIQADGFWQNMQEWYAMKNSLASMLSDLAAYSNGTVANSADASAVASKIGAASAKMKEIDGTPLLTPGVYGTDRYCPAISWPYIELSKAQMKWNGISAKLSELPALDARAHALALRTQVWLNYTKTRASDFLKMERGLEARALSLEKRLASYNKTFQDDVGLNSKFADYNSMTKAAVAKGNSGRYHEALGQEVPIIALGDALEKQMNEDFASLNLTLRRLDTAKKGQEKLAGLNLTAEAKEIGDRAAALNKTLAAKPKSTAIDAIASQAKELEEDTLQAVAAAMLGVQQEEETRNATPPAPPQPSKNEPAPAPASGAPSCPLPFAIGAGGVGLAAAYGGRKRAAPQ